MVGLITVTIFALVFAPTFLLLRARLQYAEETQRLERRLAARPAEADLDITRRQRSTLRSRVGWLYRLNLLKSLRERMFRAGLYMRVADMVTIIVLAFGMGTAAGQALGLDFPIPLAVGFACSFLPLAYLQFRSQRRLAAFDRQLPYALDLIKSSLEAGHTLQRGLELVVKELGDPLGAEFRTALEQTRIGFPLMSALEQMLQRMPEENLRLLVVAVRVQSEAGSSLAEIVGRISEIARNRQRLRLQIRTTTAQARMSGLLVAVLPLIVLVAFAIIHPSYTQILFADPSGIRILEIAAGLDLVAFFAIRRLMRVEY